MGDLLSPPLDDDNESSKPTPVSTAMIVRRFVRQHHEEYGFDGWRPQWIPHFDPSEGLGVAHDTLEHVLHDAGTGSLSCEKRR